MHRLKKKDNPNEQLCYISTLQVKRLALKIIAQENENKDLLDSYLEEMKNMESSVSFKMCVNENISELHVLYYFHNIPYMSYCFLEVHSGI